MDERKNEARDGALLLDDADAKRAPTGQDGQSGDGKAEESAGILEEILDRMDLDVDVDVREDGEKIVLDLDGPDVGRVIGKKGMTLDALQFLLNKIVNRFPDGRRHVVVDSGDYRERHDNGLISMARREAKRVVTEGEVVTLEPMSARDRRVIHLSLAKFEGVTTASHGQGMQRRIQIMPADGEQPRSRGRGRRR
ncbi:MAG: KH domain-containing protein [Deltaproteobacteria bacterium]|nr:KH domain-containing protein [Deltaproteobacteria bacterium]